MIVERPADVTAGVLAVMDRTEDPRLREILRSMIRHLHAFVTDVHLTEPEFRAAVGVLNELGGLTSDTHNETMLMAGSLGVSSLVCLLNNGADGTEPTSQNLLGPFWRLNSPRVEHGGSIIRSPTPGATLFMEGQVQDRAGRPIAGAEVDVWHSSTLGFYENQDPTQADMNLRGTFTTNADGVFAFRSIKPAGYPIPTDGPVGRLLKMQERHPFRPAHVHALIFKPGYKTLTSQVYDPEDPNIETDAQFGVTRALIGDYVRHDEPHPTAPDVTVPWYSLRYVFTMELGEAVLPKPPIK